MAKLDLKKVKGVKVVTPKFIMSFPKLSKPEAYEGKGQAYYSTVMLFDKDQDLKPMKQLIRQAIVEAFGKDKTKWPKISLPWRDGNTKSDFEGYKGRYYAGAKSKNRPTLVNVKKETIPQDEIDTEFYGGAICQAVLRAKVTLSGRNYFVTFYLQGIMKIKDGERFGGGCNPEEDFDDFDTEDENDFDNDEIDNDDDSFDF